MTRVVTLSFLTFRNETEGNESKAEFVNVEDIYERMK